MLAVIFKLYYPAVIQVIQAVVRFKRIQLNPLPRYQQSKEILRLMTEEMEWYRMTVWSEGIMVSDDNETNHGHKLEVPEAILAQYASDDSVVNRIENFSHNAVGLVTVTLTQLTETFKEEDQILVLQHNYRCHIIRQESSTDEIVRHMAQLMKLADSFFLFLDAIKCGDAIAIEHTMVEWLPRWRAVGKHRYVDLVLRMIETNYGTLSPYQLEEPL